MERDGRALHVLKSGRSANVENCTYSYIAKHSTEVQKKKFLSFFDLNYYVPRKIVQIRYRNAVYAMQMSKEERYKALLFGGVDGSRKERWFVISNVGPVLKHK